MIVELLTHHHLEFLSLKEAAEARVSLHLSKCHIVGNHMSRLKFRLEQFKATYCMVFTAFQTHTLIISQSANRKSGTSVP